MRFILYMNYQNEINKRLKHVLNKKYKRIHARLVAIGVIKGLCHNSDVSEKFEKRIAKIIYKKFKISWNKVRDIKRIRKYRRDNPVCEKCNRKRTKHIHHIVPISKGGLEREDNYMAVCLECHIKLHPELPKGFIK